MLRKTLKPLSALTEEEISAFMEGLPSDDDDTGDEDGSECDSDDSDIDSNYICPDDNLAIDAMLNSTEIISGAIEMSLDVSNIENMNELPFHNDIATSPALIPLEPITPSLQIGKDTSPIYARSRRRQRNSNLQEENVGAVGTSSSVFDGTAAEIRNDLPALKSIIWKKKNLQLHINELVFRGEKNMPAHLKVLKTPYDCFTYFLTDDFLQHLAAQMNLYARQKYISTKFQTDAMELRRFIGILFFKSVYRYPSIRSFWGRHCFEAVRETMTRHRFEDIRSNLHFNDNSMGVRKGAPNYDPLYKVRPLINHFNERFISIPMRQRLCVDEQMCPTKMRGNPIRQYMPAKPHKWGSKLFVLCDSYGFSYAFEIYSGAGDNVILQNCPDLGAASNVVVRLSKNVPNNINHIIYFDNCYTSLGLMIYLKSRGIYSLGTVRTNRVPNIKLSNDSELDKKNLERGYSEEYVATALGIDISNVLWRDTKNVRLLSTYVGSKNFISINNTNSSSKVTRWDRKRKENVEINCPNIIKEYNMHMGGVDLMDGLIGRYHINMKTRKWTNRLFYHLLDVTMTNSYILYHRLHKGTTNCPLPEFRTEVAESLCLIGSSATTQKRGRPSSSTPPRKQRKTYHLSENIRYDQLSHWCDILDRSGKKLCKMPGCNAQTQAFCVKCKVNLCMSSTKKCFFNYHNPT